MVNRISASGDIHVVGNITGSSLLVGGGSSTRPSVAFHPTYDAGFSSTVVQNQIDFQSGDAYIANFDEAGMVINTGMKFMVASSASFGRTTIGDKTVTVTGDISASGAYFGSRRFNVSSATDDDLTHGDIIYTGGGSTTLGDIVYMKTDGEWGSARANATSTSTSLLGIALGTDPDSDGVLLRGAYTLDHDVGNNQGVALFLSDGTAGQATVTAPADTSDVVRVIGYNLGDNDEIWFCPDNTWVEIA
jgi:hypothetical protein